MTDDTRTNPQSHAWTPPEVLLTEDQLTGMSLWDRDVMLAPEHRAVGAYLVSLAIAEIRHLRAKISHHEKFADDEWRTFNEARADREEWRKGYHELSAKYTAAKNELEYLHSIAPETLRALEHAANQPGLTNSDATLLRALHAQLAGTP